MARKKKLKHTSIVMARVELTPQAKERLNAISDERGMTLTAVFSRLALWFTGQPPMVQGYVLGQLPDDVQVNMTKLLAQQLTEGMRAGVRE